jgi:hypothetical protein
MSPFLGIPNPRLCRCLDRANGLFKPLVAPAFAAQFLPSSRRLLRNTLEPSRSVLPQPRHHPGGVRQLRRCARGRHRCVSLLHSPRCFGTFCPPSSGKLDRPDIWSLPRGRCRRWSMGYSADGSLLFLHNGPAGKRQSTPQNESIEPSRHSDNVRHLDPGGLAGTSIAQNAFPEAERNAVLLCLVSDVLCLLNGQAFGVGEDRRLLRIVIG